MLLFIFILVIILLPRLSKSVGGFILGKTESKETVVYHEHNTYIQNQQNNYLYAKKPDPVEIKSGDWPISGIIMPVLLYSISTCSLVL